MAFVIPPMMSSDHPSSWHECKVNPIHPFCFYTNVALNYTHLKNFKYTWETTLFCHEYLDRRLRDFHCRWWWRQSKRGFARSKMIFPEGQSDRRSSTGLVTQQVLHWIAPSYMLMHLISQGRGRRHISSSSSSCIVCNLSHANFYRTLPLGERCLEAMLGGAWCFKNWTYSFWIHYPDSHCD